MKKVTTYESKKVFVLGLARSGVAAAKLLHQLGAFVTVNDGKSFEENPEAQELVDLGIKVVTGSHPVELLDEDFALMVKNPGIPYNNPMVQKAQAQGIPVITEIQLAYEISEAPIVAITGTNGKTTTTTMIGQLLNAQRENGVARLAGNIGFPASEVAVKAQAVDTIAMEVSSFQLMGITTFQPKIAVITNVYSTHLDYHGSQAAYEAAKWQIQKNMTADDILILNWKQEKLRAWGQKTQAQVLYFSTTQEVNGTYVKDGVIYFQDEAVMPVAKIALPGNHNLENALAAITVAKLQGVSNEAIIEVLSTFHGVEHRTQFVGEIAGRKFINDSKATNSLATKQALGAFPSEQTILLAGGLDRGNGFDDLIPDLTGVKAIITFGQTAAKLQETAKKAGIPLVLSAENAESAVPLAFANSVPGDVILLSPANASWDQYPSFEVRGERFVAAVEKLKEEQN